MPFGSGERLLSVQGITRALGIIEAVAEHQPVGVGELSRLLDLPKSTVQRNLQALASAGWIRPVGDETTRWMLTSRALIVGYRASREGGLREAALPAMRQLRDLTDETITLQGRDGDRRLILIEQVNSHQAVRTFNRLGTVTPLPLTSSGMAVLASLSDDEVTQVLAEPLPRSTEATITDIAVIRAEVERVRKRGYAINHGQNRVGVCAVGAAVLDSAGRPIAGLGISMPATRFDEARVPEWGRLVIGAARQIGSELGE
jgi:IclR family acetate operon transcriptional repressor